MNFLINIVTFDKIYLIDNQSRRPLSVLAACSTGFRLAVRD